jgi:hypothetical protein
MTAEEDDHELPTSSPFAIKYQWTTPVPSSSQNRSDRLLKTESVFNGRFILPFHFELDCMNPPIVEALENFQWMSDPMDDLAFEFSSPHGGGNF